MRVVGNLSMLAAIVIIAIAAVLILRSITGQNTVETGEQKAARELRSPGEEPIDPQGEIRDTVRDAMVH